MCCCGIKGSQKQHVWKEIITAANSVGVGNQSPVDIQIFNLYPGNTFITQHILTTCYNIITVINIWLKSGGQTL